MGQPDLEKIDPLAFETVKGCQLLSFSEKEGSKSNYEMFSSYMATEKCKLLFYYMFVLMKPIASFAGEVLHETVTFRD